MGHLAPFTLNSCSESELISSIIGTRATNLLVGRMLIYHLRVKLKPKRPRSSWKNLDSNLSWRTPAYWSAQFVHWTLFWTNSTSTGCLSPVFGASTRDITVHCKDWTRPRPLKSTVKNRYGIEREFSQWKTVIVFLFLTRAHHLPAAL